MAKQKIVSIEVLQELLTKEEFDKNTSYIFEYFDIAGHLYKQANIILRIVKTRVGYNIYEEERNFLLTTIRRVGTGKYIILPIGVARVIACSILDDYNADSANDGRSSIYQSLFALNEVDLDNERIDIYLFYLGIILINLYNFNLQFSKLHSYKVDRLYISGVKEEFYYIAPNELYHSRVRYNISAYNDRGTVKIIKNYSSGEVKPEDKFEVTIDEIIESALNEFRASKKKEI